MKYIKSYENINKPQIGDYVILNAQWRNYPKIEEFVNNTIGQIVNINKKIYYVKFDTPPENIKNIFQYSKEYNYFKTFLIQHIVEFSPNKKELKIKLAANKYNI